MRHLPHRHRRARAGVRGGRLAVLRDRSTAHQAAPGWLVTPGLALRAGRAFAPFPETRLRLRRRSRIQLPYHRVPALLALVLSDAQRLPTCRLGHRHDPPPCDPTLPAWQAPPRVVPADQLRVLRSSRQRHARRHGPYHPMRVDRAPGLCACWSPPRWLGERSTVVASAERAKDAAEAYRSGDPLVYDLKEVTNRVEGAMA